MQSTKWRLHDDYRSSTLGPVLEAIEVIDQYKIVGPYALGIHSDAAYSLNYYSDSNVVYFHPDTIGELLQSKKLKEAFALYGIKSAIGYPSVEATQIESTLHINTISWDKD